MRHRNKQRASSSDKQRDSTAWMGWLHFFLALRDMVRAVVVVTGDSDFVPAFKFVRREGVKVMLCTLGHKGARRELRAHADFVLS